METLVKNSLEERINEALAAIRPYLERDGGNLQIKEITPEGILKIELLGACMTCPMSAMTLKAGIEQTVLQAVPEIKAVIAINLM